MKKALLHQQVLLLVIGFLPAVVQAGSLTEIFQWGKIDWSKGTAEVVGIAGPPSKTAPSGPHQVRARSEAENSARRKLFELLGKIRVDSRTSIQDLASQSETVKKRLQELVERSAVRTVRHRTDGGVEAMIRIDLNGALAELVLPEEIRTINAVHQPKVPVEENMKTFTGLVVDCSGVKLKPAMSPKVYDEDGKMVYGPPFISRENAVKEGVAGYARDLSSAKRDERVASKPLIVKGLQIAKTGNSDMVISNADAARVWGSAGNLKSLQRCRVVIVLD